MVHEIVGEGTYGCVIKPSMKCEDDEKRNYSNKVSKVMLEKHAKEEYEEVHKISSVPGIKKYILIPDICKPKIDQEFLSNVKNCKNEKLKKHDPSTYRMLIMEDGGITILQFIESMLPILGKKDVCIFLTKIYDLMNGLCFFHDYYIIHHDIHMKNVVYNIKTGTLKFIDFGFMQNVKQFIQDNINNKNGNAQTWFNFPPEYKCANNKDYVACGYSLPYNKYVERLAYTFDWYSLGVMMQTVLKEIYFHDEIIPKTSLEKIYNFFLMVAEPNIERRNYNVKTLPLEYKKLLQKLKIWQSKKVKPIPTTESIQLQEKLNIKTAQILTKSDRNSLIKHMKDLCKTGHVFNHTTRRCLKKCKSGFIRNNATKRCIKRKQSEEKKKN
jgi:serine/threonine protein kinase